ncbi:hypothetical protein [Pyruvatibacter sp.]|uniref:hypothetical protein n=1 Tax=Pyruvatibacter sp. TaxID=1981328 RepID=UPI003267E959
MLRTILSATVGTAVTLAATQAFAQTSPEFTPGHGALNVFDGDGIAATPLWLKIWFAIMLGAFATGLVFIRRQPIARWAVGGFLMPFLIAGPIFQALGLPFLGGSIAIAHLVFWTPAFVLLLLRRPFLDPDQTRGFKVWSAVMTGVMAFSFIFDIRDAVIYSLHFAGA